MMYVKTDPDGVSNPRRYTLGELRRDNPSTQFPKNIPQEILEEYNVYELHDAEPPEYDCCTQQLVESWTLDGDVWTRTWTIESLPVNQIAMNLVEKVADQRYAKETSGIIWPDSQGKLWYIATDLDSQGRIDSAVSTVERGDRVENSIWKTAEINPQTGGFTLTYRPTTNAEILTWGTMVAEYVQKCFTAEANTVNKIMAGDFTADFQTEFDAL